MRTLTYGRSLPDDPRWGWERPLPPPPTVEQMQQGLVDVLDTVLSHQPIKQQRIYIAVLWDEDDWMVVDIRDAPPDQHKPKEMWCDCVVDFDQYHGTVDDIRCMTAEALAEDVIEKQIREFGPWQDDPPDYDDYN